MPRPPLPLGQWGHIHVSAGKDGLRIARARFRDFDGVVRRVEASAKSKAAAEQALLTKLRLRARPAAGDINGTTAVSIVIDLWLDEVRDSGRASATVRSYTETCQRHLLHALGNVRLQELRVSLLDNHLRSVRERSGPAAAKMTRTVLAQVLDLAVRHDAIASNPARNTRPIATVKREIKSLTWAEVRDLRHDLAGDAKAARADLPDLLDFLIATGCRINEALAVRWSSIKLDQPEPAVTIDATVTRGQDGRLELQPRTKTDAGRRQLYLPDFAVSMLLRRHVDQPANALDLVFPSSTGTLRDSHNFNRALRSFGVRHPRWLHLTAHSFRRTLATHISRTWGSQTAAEQLGHASAAVTEGHYIERTRMGPRVQDMFESLTESD